MTLKSRVCIHDFRKVGLQTPKQNTVNFIASTPTLPNGQWSKNLLKRCTSDFQTTQKDKINDFLKIFLKVM